MAKTCSLGYKMLNFLNEIFHVMQKYKKCLFRLPYDKAGGSETVLRMYVFLIC